MAKEALSDDDRQLIWNASEINDGDMQVELLKVLSGGAGDMKSLDRNYFLGKLAMSEPKSLTGRHIELITEICTTMRGA
jgi:Neuraminidase (sialidase)